MKAAINGAINLSVLDGWWGEGYDGDNGWAITPHPELDPETRDQQEATELLTILENRVVPLYFSRDAQGEPKDWIDKSKRSMKSILPHFNSIRMAKDYLRDFYVPAAAQGRRLAADEGAAARQLAAWRDKVHRNWPRVRVRLEEQPPKAVNVGEPVSLDVAVYLNGLDPTDVEVECVLGILDNLGEFVPHASLKLEVVGENAEGETRYHADLCSRENFAAKGLEHYKIRVYPHDLLLTHRFECGLMLWI
jgi:starch phosphorylase